MAIVLDPLPERGYGVGPNGQWQAEKTFLVHNDSGAIIDEAEAQAAVLAQYPIDAVHPRNPSLKVDSVLPAGNGGGPGIWKIRVAWSIPENGGSHGGGTGDLLSRKPVVLWSDRQKEIPMEWDGDNRLLCNSAGFPPSSPATRTLYVDVLQLTRYEPYYNIDLKKQLIGRVNHQAVALGGVLYQKGQVCMTAMRPAAEFPVGTTPIKMLYEWEFDDHATQPFQTYFPDKGTYGWVTVGGATISGPIGIEVTAGGVTQFQQVTEAVLLDGTGKPLNTAYKIGYRSGDTWVAGSPVAFPGLSSAEAIYGQPSTDDIPSVMPWIRRYRRVLSADFSVLGI